MTKEEFWMQATIAEGPEWADTMLDEYEQRFGECEYSLGALPPFNKLLEGVMVEGCKIIAYYADGLRQFVIKASFDGTWSLPRYTNCSSEAEVHRWLAEFGSEVIKEAIEEVRDER
jgi:hypothetical protein